MKPWDCHKCGAPGVRNLLKQGWCEDHLLDLYDTFDPQVFVDLHLSRLASAAEELDLAQRAVLDGLLTAPTTNDIDEVLEWAARLQRAADLGLITRKQARDAFDRAVIHVAA